jgi:hypothetical protein
MAASTKGDPKKEARLSADVVRQMAGPVADHTVVAILETGASIADLEVAVIYARGEGNYVDRQGHPLSGKAAQVSDILAKDELYLVNNER